MFYFIVFILVVCLAVYILRRRPSEISDKHEFYDGRQFSGKEFYEKVIDGVQQRNIPDVTWSMVTEYESSLASAKREYLAVRRNEYAIYICAAPFGTGYYFSWHLGVYDLSLIEKIPIINSLVGKNRSNKTFFQKDTEVMFKSIVICAFNEALESVTANKGERQLQQEQLSVGTAN
jgi:hypothetical protein